MGAESPVPEASSPNHPPRNVHGAAGRQADGKAVALSWVLLRVETSC